MSQFKFYAKFSFFKIIILLIFSILLVSVFLKWLFNFDLIYYGLLCSILVILILVFRLAQLVYKFQFDKMNDINQIESLLWIYQEMKPRSALPPMGVYAGTPDFYKIILSHIKEFQPKVILELGSGVSTAVISEFLRYNEIDTLHYAIDHIEKYAEESKSYLKDTNSKIIYTPLKMYEIEGNSYLWYDIEKLKDVNNIDLLIVDGPPEDLNKLARFPALELLWHKLSKDAIIILDDSNRNDEKIIIEKWKKKYEMGKMHFYTAKGTTILSKRLKYS